jgi:hypothetical protein
MLLLMPGNDIIVNLIDLEEENHGNVPCHQHTTTFRLQLVLKLDMLVEMYAWNYDSQDGLVNGADEILKAYKKQKKFMSSGLSSMTRTLATDKPTSYLIYIIQTLRMNGHLYCEYQNQYQHRQI